jgi:cathepsin L
MSAFGTIVAIVVLVATAASAHRAPKWHELTADYTFEAYSKDFGKVHAAAELPARRELFAAELLSVLAHNAAGASWKMGVNRYSDWTNAERRRLGGSRGVPQGLDAEDAATRAAVPFPARGKQPTLRGAFPQTRDYRANVPAVMTAVKDQGNCGDCWAHAATETIESSWALATGDLIDLSQQQVTSCTPPRGIPHRQGWCYSCNGSFAHYGFDYVAKLGGLGEEWLYPFTSFNGSEPQCREKELMAPWPQVSANISGFHLVAPNDEDAAVQALNELGPLAVQVWAFPWISYETGVFDQCAYKNSTRFNQTEVYALDHAVVLAGYGYDAESEMKYWIVRNSWAATWGEHGYIRLHRADVAPCGKQYSGTGCFPGNSTGFATKACGCSGVLTYPTFPIASIGK